MCTGGGYRREKVTLYIWGGDKGIELKRTPTGRKIGKGTIEKGPDEKAEEQEK